MGRYEAMLSVCIVGSLHLNQLEFCALFWAVIWGAGEDLGLRRM